MLTIVILVAVGYPIYQWRKSVFIERTDQALRRHGIAVSHKQHRSGGSVRPKHRQPPHGSGMRGPIEGRFWGQFMP